MRLTRKVNGTTGTWGPPWPTPPCGLWSQRLSVTTGIPGLQHRYSPFGCESCFLSGWLKNILCQDPDTQNEAIHLMIVQRAKWHLKIRVSLSSRTKGRQRPLVQSPSSISCWQTVCKEPFTHAGACFICRSHSGKSKPILAQSGLSSFSWSYSYRCPIGH